MIPLEQALRERFRTPEDVLRKLGMDENLLGQQQQKETSMKITRGIPIKPSAYARILASCAKSKLAQDASLDAQMLAPLFKGVDASNFTAKRKSITKGLSSLLSNRLAEDQASPDDVALRLLDIIHGPGSAEPGEPGEAAAQQGPLVEPAAGEEEGPEDQALTNTGMGGEGSDVGEREMVSHGARDQGELSDKVCSYLESQGVSPDVCEGVKAMIAGGGDQENKMLSGQEAAKDAEITEGQTIGGASELKSGEKSPAEDEDDDEDKDDTAKDQPPKFPGKPMVGGGMVKDSKMASDSKKGFVTRPAMDAAIQAAVQKAREDERHNRNAIREAERVVRPFVGDLSIAYDSADQVYGAALKALNINIKGVHPSAYRTILELQPKPGHSQRKPQLAMDENATKSYAERFPGATRLKVI